MALIEVDIVDAQTLQRGVDLFGDLRPRQALVAVAHREIDLGRQDVAVALALRQNFAEERFRSAPSVDVRRVDEIDPELEGALDACRRLVAFDADTVGQPRAQRNFGDLEIAGAEFAVFHGAHPNGRNAGLTYNPHARLRQRYNCASLETR